MNFRIMFITSICILATPVATMAAEEKAPNVSLNEAEIVTDVIGYVLKPDRTVPQRAFDFTESFAIDGVWKGYRAMRGPTHYNGSWTIEGDQLCVHFRQSYAGPHPAGSTYCRVVWKDTVTNHIKMEDMAGSPSGDKFVDLTKAPITR